MEIERKFLIKYMPEHLERYKTKHIEQGYLCTNPVLRIRKSNEKYILTYKSKKGISEEFKTAIESRETEEELTEQAYYHLREKVDNNLIRKTRYIIPLESGENAELDIFEEHLQGLCFVEVEFESQEKAAAFNPPDWFGQDVSFDKRYRNSNISAMKSAADIK